MTKLKWLQSQTNNRIKCYGCGKHDYLGVKSDRIGYSWLIICHQHLGGCGIQANLSKFQRHEGPLTSTEYLYTFKEGNLKYWFYLFQDKTKLLVDDVLFLEKQGFARMKKLALFL